MTETTIQEIQRLRDSSADAFERHLFGAILALDAADTVSESINDEIEPGEMARCAQCDDLWPEEDLYTDNGLCPNCVITNYYEARRRRLERERVIDGEYEISDADSGL